MLHGLLFAQCATLQCDTAAAPLPYRDLNDTARNMRRCRGKYWAGLRASCERVFHSGQLALYAPLMNAAAEKLAARLQQPAPASGPATAADANTSAAADQQAASGATTTAAMVAGAAVAAGSVPAIEEAASVPDVAAAAQSSHPKAVNLSAALGTMTLEVIGTSAFG